MPDPLRFYCTGAPDPVRLHARLSDLPGVHARVTQNGTTLSLRRRAGAAPPERIELLLNAIGYKRG